MTSNLSVPYTKMKPNWQEYVSPDDLPENVTFDHPSRYRAATTHAILKLWRKRQSNGQQPFQFRATLSKEGVPEPASYPHGMFAMSTSRKVKSVKGKGKNIAHDSMESSDGPDTIDGDDSLSVSASLTEESEGSSDDWVPPDPAIVHDPQNVNKTTPPDTEHDILRNPTEPMPAKTSRKMQPEVTIIMRPHKNTKAIISTNPQLATPIGSEPPEESNVAAMKSLRVTAIERRTMQTAQGVIQWVQTEKSRQSSIRKSPRKR